MSITTHLKTAASAAGNAPEEKYGIKSPTRIVRSAAYSGSIEQMKTLPLLASDKLEASAAVLWNSAKNASEESATSVFKGAYKTGTFLLPEDATLLGGVAIPSVYARTANQVPEHCSPALVFAVETKILLYVPMIHMAALEAHLWSEDQTSEIVDEAFESMPCAAQAYFAAVARAGDMCHAAPMNAIPEFLVDGTQRFYAERSGILPFLHARTTWSEDASKLSSLISKCKIPLATREDAASKWDLLRKAQSVELVTIIQDVIGIDEEDTDTTPFCRALHETCYTSEDACELCKNLSAVILSNSKAGESNVDFEDGEAEVDEASVETASVGVLWPFIEVALSEVPVDVGEALAMAYSGDDINLDDLFSIHAWETHGRVETAFSIAKKVVSSIFSPLVASFVERDLIESETNIMKHIGAIVSALSKEYGILFLDDGTHPNSESESLFLRNGKGAVRVSTSNAARLMRMKNCAVVAVSKERVLTKLVTTKFQPSKFAEYRFADKNDASSRRPQKRGLDSQPESEHLRRVKRALADLQQQMKRIGA